MKLSSFIQIILLLYFLNFNSFSKSYEIVFNILVNNSQSILKNINDTKSKSFLEASLKIQQYLTNNFISGYLYDVEIFLVYDISTSSGNGIVTTPVIVNEESYLAILDRFTKVSLIVVKDYSFQELNNPNMFIIDGSNSKGFFLSTNGVQFEKDVLISGIQFINWKFNQLFIVRTFQDSSFKVSNCIFKNSNFIYRTYITMCLKLVIENSSFINSNSPSLYFNNVDINNSNFINHNNNSLIFNNISNLIITNSNFNDNYNMNHFIEINNDNNHDDNNNNNNNYTIILNNISIYNNTPSNNNNNNNNNSLFSFLVKYNNNIDNSSNNNIYFNNIQILNNNNNSFQNIINLNNSLIYINNSNIPSNNYTVLGNNNKIYSNNSTHNSLLSQLFCNIINDIVYKCNNSSNSNNNKDKIKLIISIIIPVSIVSSGLFIIIIIIFIKKKNKTKVKEIEKRKNIDRGIVHGVIEESIVDTNATATAESLNFDNLPTFLNEIELDPIETVDSS